ncbi:hypothetical protein [Amycolatopsis benzoatilytica]|uniref:sunset domain-containing protein n=1 Tax=Amycolatopsis benzoatilytica TaxID=346045 RepID=UPI00036FF55B|nr:hypothetical protein [Amycolatopsis benzoatilytica]
MSIFGQVWLWSLLAFFVGALIAWLVLARPARKRVQELEAELSAAHADSARAAASTPARAASAPDRAAASTQTRTAALPPAEDWTRDQREHAPTEVFQAAAPVAAFSPESEYDAEYRTAPEPAEDDDVDEAFARAEAQEDPAGPVHSSPATEVVAPVEGGRAAETRDSGDTYRASATDYLQPVDRDLGSHHLAEPDHDSGYHRIAEPLETPASADEYDSGYHQLQEPIADGEHRGSFRPAAEPDGGSHGLFEPAGESHGSLEPVEESASRGAFEPAEPASENWHEPAGSVVPEEEPDGGRRRVPEPADGLSSLERRLDPAALDPAPSTPESDEAASLFRPSSRTPEPESEPDWFSQPGGAPRSAFEEPQQAAENPVGHLEEAPATDHLTPSAPVESTEDSGLPKRQRRESPLGGFDPPRPIQPSMRSVERREPDVAGGHSGSLFEPSVQPNQAAMAAPEPPPARQTAADAVPPGPFGPGSAMPRPGGGRPADGFTVKASVTALRYCVEDSAQFPKMVAEVWFRTAADAERVGFRPLH